MNKVFLYRPISIIGRIICIVTRSEYSHAAIEVDGILWDSSETRGSFGMSDIINSERDHIWFNLDGDLTRWLESVKGTKYDWKGVLGYFVYANDKEKFYCFELIWDAMKHLNIVSNQPKHVTADKLIRELK